MINVIKQFVKNEIVLVISLLLAVVSAFFVHPNMSYLGYIDFRTLSILLSLMLVMAGLQKLGVFRQIGEMLVSKVSTLRSIVIVLVLLCFFFSMLITNDVALITFVPFTVVVLSLAKKQEVMIITIVLETIAANLGSMTTPMGNPQNLYLYSLSNMSFAEFILLMLPYAGLSLVLLMIAVFIGVKKDSVQLDGETHYERGGREKLKIVIYIFLFIVELLVVLRLLDFWVGLVVAVVAVLVIDRVIILKADYSLLFTFTFLFIFIGNMKQIDVISNILQSVVNNREVLVGVAASQIISNVPSAILLSGFTDNIRGLIVGTNLGGLGTLIASMASLISFKQYGYQENANKGKYIATFTLWNVLFLIILYVEHMLIG